MSLKILMIDDDPAITELIGMLLRSHGFDVISCNESDCGIQMAKNEDPDIILLDLMMSGQDGWQICKTIRSFTNTPIVILSAINDPTVISSALDAGADDYLVKPTPGGVLVAHVNNLARRHRAEKDKNSMMRHSCSPKGASSTLNQKPLQA